VRGGNRRGDAHRLERRDERKERINSGEEEERAECQLNERTEPASKRDGSRKVACPEVNDERRARGSYCRDEAK
jgi:hypothetical protein